MYSLSTRVNKIFFYGMVNLFILSSFNYLSGLYLIKDKDIDVDFKFINHYYFQNFRNSKYKLRWDNLISSFQLKVNDLKNIDNWNLK